MTEQVLRVQQEGPVRWLWLNRSAQRNALNGEMSAALAEQVESIESDDSTSVVVIAGEGTTFCAGADFRHLLEVNAKGGVLPFLSDLSQTLTRIEASTKPWVAAIHGHAIAGGIEIALVCDVVIAAEGTLIGDGHLNNRLLPGAGSSVRLERAVGRSLARWLHLTGDLLPAERFLDAGWLHSVVPEASLLDEAQRVARHLAARSGPAQRAMKHLLNDLQDVNPSRGLKRELEAFEDNWRSGEVAIALQDFLASRSTASRVTQEA